MTSFSRRIDRRQFLISLLAVGVSPGLFARTVDASSHGQEIFVSAQGKTGHEYGLGWLDSRQKKTGSSPSGFRGHGASIHPLRSGSAVMYARRPGDVGIEVNLQSGEVERSFQCKRWHHLFGHGCFSADGKALFTSEADYRTGEGKIAIRDSLSYEQIGEYASGGIGPHEIKLMPDGKTLVIANGGLLTHPDSGRRILNLDTMESSLTYLDLETGKVLDSFRLPEAKASIRHLDVAEDGTVAFATQVQREAMSHDELVPLGAIHKPGQAIALLSQPAALIHQMKDYMGSVAINSRSRIAGFTSPRGNVAAFWHMDKNRFVAYHALHDVCGLTVSSDQQHFVISNSAGQLRFLDATSIAEDRSRRLSFTDMHWDNHLLSTRI